MATAGAATKKRREQGQIIEIDTGAKVTLVDYDRDNDTWRAWVICPECPEPKERYVTIPNGPKWKKYTGRCVQCAGRQRQKYDFPSKDDLRPDGSAVYWSKRRGPKVPARDARGHDHTAHAYSALRSGFTALCRACYHESRTRADVEIGDEGSILHLKIKDPSDPDKCAITCGKCKNIWYSTPSHGKALNKRSGICPECKPRKYTGEMTLPKGTKVFFEMREVVRTPGKISSRYKVAIECRGCFKERGELKYVWLREITGYLKGTQDWKELCSDCLNTSGALRRIKEERMAPSGTVTQFQRVNEQGDVPIIYALCGCERWTNWADASANWSVRPDACVEHYSSQERAKLLAKRMLAEMMQQTAAGNGEGQGNGNDQKRRRGRKPGEKYLDSEKTLTDVATFIIQIWEEKRSVNAVTLKAVVSKFHLRGERIVDRTVKSRLKSAGVDTEWPTYVESVLRDRGEI